MKKLSNKRKLLLLFIGVLIVFLSVILTIRILDKREVKKEQEPQIKEELYGFTESYVLNYEDAFCVSDNYFYVKDKNGAYLITKDNKILYKEEVDDNYGIYCEITEKENYILLSASNLKILLDTNGKILLNLKEPENSNIEFIEDLITGELYIQKLNYHEEESINTLYDKNLKEILRIESSEFPGFYIEVIMDNLIYSSELKHDSSSNLLYTSGTIYDLAMNKLEEYEKLEFITDKYIAVTYKNYVELIDTEKKKSKKYDKMETTKSNLTKFVNSKETLIIDYDGNIYEDEEKKPLGNGYYLDYTTCKEGSILKDKKNKPLHNDCGYSHDITHIDKGIFSYISSELEMAKTVIKESIIRSDISYFIGNYIKTSTYDEITSTYLYTIYDLSGKKVYDKDINYLGNNLYQLDTENKDYILDENLKTKEEHNSINCFYENICIIDDSDKKSIYINGENILNSNNIISWDIENNYLKINTLTGVILLKFEKGENFLSKEELDKIVNNGTSDIDIDIDIDKIISTYNLDFKDKIMNNKEFFNKYAYIVLNDSDLKGYEDYMFNIFEVLVDNKKHMNELYFLSRLKLLHFEALSDEEMNDLSSDAAGIYFNGDEKIVYANYLSDKHKDGVLYHELMHFIDYSINIENHDDILGLRYDVDFLIEGCAEYYSVQYFLEDKNYNSYHEYIKIVQALSTIFTEKVIQDIYFSRNTNEAFYSLLAKGGITIEDYERMLKLFVEPDYSTSAWLGKQADALIDIYYLFNDKKWYENKEFKLMISNILSGNYSGKYVDEYKMHCKKIEEIAYADVKNVDIDEVYAHIYTENEKIYFYRSYRINTHVYNEIVSYNPETEKIKVVKKYNYTTWKWENVN